MVITSVILNYKSYTDVAECLTSLLNSKIPASVELKIIVIDVESDPSKLSKLKSKYRSVKFITTTNNLGVSGGYNIGFKKAVVNNSDFVFMVTPDIIIEKSTLQILLKSIKEDKNIGMVTPKILLNTHPRKIYFIKGEIDKKRKSSGHVGYLETDNGQYDTDKLLESDFVNCSVVLMRTELFIKIGFWDESYFLYYEDIDWNMRVKAAGFRVGVVTNAIAYHEESSSTKKGSLKQEYYTTRNLLYFVNKFYSTKEKLIVYLLTLKEMISISPKLLSQKRMYVLVKYLAMFDYLQGRKGYRDIT